MEPKYKAGDWVEYNVAEYSNPMGAQFLRVLAALTHPSDPQPIYILEVLGDDDEYKGLMTFSKIRDLMRDDNRVVVHSMLPLILDSEIVAPCNEVHLKGLAPEMEILENFIKKEIGL